LFSFGGIGSLNHRSIS